MKKTQRASRRQGEAGFCDMDQNNPFPPAAVKDDNPLPRTKGLALHGNKENAGDKVANPTSHYRGRALAKREVLELKFF